MSYPQKKESIVILDNIFLRDVHFATFVKKDILSNIYFSYDTPYSFQVSMQCPVAFIFSSWNLVFLQHHKKYYWLSNMDRINWIHYSKLDRIHFGFWNLDFRLFTHVTEGFSLERISIQFSVVQMA